MGRVEGLRSAAIYRGDQMISESHRLGSIKKIISATDQRPFRAFVCDDCARFQSATITSPPESGAQSWLCAACGHFNIGSTYQCIRGEWLKLWIIDAAADRLLEGGE